MLRKDLSGGSASSVFGTCQARLLRQPGGYFSVAEGDPSILLRQKEDYDGAEPAPSSIAAANLFRLAAFCSAQKAPA